MLAGRRRHCSVNIRASLSVGDAASNKRGRGALRLATQVLVVVCNTIFKKGMDTSCVEMSPTETFIPEPRSHRRWT